ncbi:sulfotransferase family 2 domain-containing protein [Roseovarius autotrophicus]|uniref:sulfotransferase family 2 domain-containing protein n=1 Tax=Roseovarius autotrophicus TaxID=2824121 RepID=UPI0019EC0B02|nr:sulfotransferase family 2 domain-containing protein [Roseovarius autotrophicus]MBE0453406.1 sulfotransferase family 2 domain-containing protein [Roseovarius sp.]
MESRFDYFVIFAEMRTGSNFLETNLNAFGGITCHGEAFNPHFIGYPNRTEILGLTQAQRDEDPARLIGAIKAQTAGIGGFRYFHDHDPRVLDLVIDDPRCAKIVLTRNPIDSYVSWKIAQATGQWKLTNVKRRRDSTVIFDETEFETHLAALQAFQLLLLNRLQTCGQTAFYVHYDDLQSVEVMNGMARYLGCEARLESLDASLKPQNPEPLESKVENFEAMARALTRQDRLDLSRSPNFEPRRGAMVPGFVAAARAPLLYMPVRSGPEAEVRAWLAALDGVPENTLPTKLNQGALRQWMRRKPGHRRFTVLRHPVARAHAAFCDKVLIKGPGCYRDIRRTLRQAYKLPIPGGWPDEGYDLAAHRAAFVAFLTFLKANLAGQTALRVDAHWATQAALIEGMAQFGAPDVILRENEMGPWLGALAQQAGYAKPPAPPKPPAQQPFDLAAIYDDEIEQMTRAVYLRDYLLFGFRNWR